MKGNNETLIEAKNLKKSFRTGDTEQTIFENLDLNLYKGDFTIIMGSSGAGKSTLMYALSGMDRPTAGEVIVNGKTITSLNDDKLAVFRRKNCGFVFQQIYLLDKMSLMDSREQTKQHFQSNRLPHEDFLIMQKMEDKNAEIRWKMRVKELRAIAKQAIEVQTLYPKFDLRAEWKTEAFREITAKLGMCAAYEVMHFNECYSQKTTDESSATLECENKQEQERNEEKLFCRKCGTQLPLDSIFCNRCGTKVETF